MSCDIEKNFVSGDRSKEIEVRSLYHLSLILIAPISSFVVARFVISADKHIVQDLRLRGVISD